MTPIELMAETLLRDVGMLKNTIGDLSDSDLMQRPVPKANHGMWQLGHLAESFPFLLEKVAPGKIPPPPASFAGKFAKDKASVDDPKAFVSRGEVVAYLDQATIAAAGWIKTLKPEDLEKPCPVYPEFIPKIGNLVQMLSSHVSMHTGQLQVLRRKLGKPILF